MPSYYDLLEVAPTASADEIKRAFRREIAKYHPDKVQHLGREFQEIAAVKAADLTRAYKILSDEAQRAGYDAQLGSPGGAPPATPHPASPASPAAAARQATYRAPAAEPERPAPARSRFSQDREGAGDLVRKAAVARFRQAVEAEFTRWDETPVPGFDVVCTPPKGAFWSKVPPRVLARVVAHVDAAALTESWTMASRIKKDEQRDVCVFVMGPEIAPAGELAHAIAEERRKPAAAAGKLIMVPVNTKSWNAFIPNDAPPVVKSLIARLKSL